MQRSFCGPKWCKSIFFIFAIPLIITFLTLLIKKAVGPFWLSPNFDPSYLYLFNSLYIIDHLTPSFVTHPGTPLQIIGALVIRIFHPLADSRQIVVDACRNPEAYLNLIYFSLYILFFISLIWTGWYAYKRTKNLLFALFIQSGAFLYLSLRSYDWDDYVLPIITNVNAETLIITICNLYTICLIKLFFNHKSFPAAIWFGIVCGLGVASKLTFIPLLVAPLILLPKIKDRMVFIFSCVFSFFISTIPVLHRYSQIFVWYFYVLTHKGFHATGSVGFVNLASFIATVKRTLAVNWFFFLFQLASISSVIICKIYISRYTSDILTKGFRGVLKFLLALGMVSVIHVIMVGKQPASHYISPLIGLFGFIAAITYWFFRSIVFPQYNRRVDMAAYIFLIMFIFANTGYAIYFQKKLNDVNTEIYNFSRMVYSKYKGCIISGYYRSSSKEFALDFGDYNAGNKVYGGILRSLYPHTILYNFWERRHHRFGKTVPYTKLAEVCPCLLLYGSKCDFSRKSFIVEEIAANRKEALYRIKSSTAGEALAHYIKSKVFYVKHDYVSAYRHALKADYYGFPRMAGYLNQLHDLLGSQADKIRQKMKER